MPSFGNCVWHPIQLSNNTFLVISASPNRTSSIKWRNRRTARRPQQTPHSTILFGRSLSLSGVAHFAPCPLDTASLTVPCSIAHFHASRTVWDDEDRLSIYMYYRNPGDLASMLGEGDAENPEKGHVSHSSRKHSSNRNLRNTIFNYIKDSLRLRRIHIGCDKDTKKRTIRAV